MPVDLKYDLGELEKYFDQHEEPPVIAFYGGEPLVNYNKMIEIMNAFPASTFMLQTNGTLLNRLSQEYIRKFNSVLISVDGRPDLTNLNRGGRVYQRAITGARHLRDSGFTGDLIARMTASSIIDIEQDVKYLLQTDEIDFDHIHWQLDVLWDIYYEENKKSIQTWLLERYNPGISNLAEFWVQNMESDHTILGIVPFLGITYTLLTGENITQPRCGAGHDFFSITTDGRITICPILPSVSFAVVGDIQSDSPTTITEKI